MFSKMARFATLFIVFGLLAACSTSLAQVGVMKAAKNNNELRCYQYSDTDAMQSQRVFACLDSHAKPQIISTGVGPGPAGLVAGVLGSAVEGAVGAAISSSGGGDSHSDAEGDAHSDAGHGDSDHGVGEVSEGGHGDEGSGGDGHVDGDSGHAH